MIVDDMIYVFDTSSLVHAFKYFKPDIFPSFWKNFHAIVKAKRFTSVREVYTEVSTYGDHLSEWADKNKVNLFTDPAESEQKIVLEILSDKHNRELVPKSKRIKNVPVADPFVIAKAKSISGCVVTEDGLNVRGELRE